MTYWPGAELAVEAGCRASLHGPKGADGQREEEEDTEINSVRTGFIPSGPQNWAGPGRESEEKGRVCVCVCVCVGRRAEELFISFYSGFKEIHVSRTQRYLCTRLNICACESTASAYLHPLISQ